MRVDGTVRWPVSARSGSDVTEIHGIGAVPCRHGDVVLKRNWGALAVALTIATLVPVSGTAWGAQRVALYNWGDPWSTGHSFYKYPSPTSVQGVPGEVVQISASNSTSYALTKTGQVWAWGAGQFGALGNGTAPAVSKTPVRVDFPKGVTITSLPTPMPYDTGMAIDSHGHVWGWGPNVYRSLCIAKANLKRPQQLPFTHVTLASGAGGHALYLADGQLYSCGWNAKGELGDGATKDSSRPVHVVGLPHEAVTSLVSSWEDSGAVLADGSFFDWGFNAADQLGNGTTTNSDMPVRVDLPSKVREVSMGGSSSLNGQTVALLADGSVWTWGSDHYGQLGDGKVAPASGPTRVSVPSGVSFAMVDSGGATEYAIDTKGAVWSWGQNNVGELGTHHYGPSDVPTRTALVLSCVSSTAWNVEGIRNSPSGRVGCGPSSTSGARARR
jgi:alpha-tubulin suppressor-like RCC1 family protein